MSDRVVALLSNRRYVDGGEVDDLHPALGAVCALAELHEALPGILRTPQPLRPVIDRRSFIQRGSAR
jgi:hypothetical protein